MAKMIRPTTFLEWAGRNVSQSLGGFVKSITYTDNLSTDESEAPDEISLTLSNVDGRFLDAWYPSKGDSLKAGIQYLDLTWHWGGFEIDDVRFRFSPDEVTIKASAAKLKRAELDKAQSRSFDNVQLSALLNIVASEAGMKSVLSGPDTTIAHVEQQAESSMSMIRRLGVLYGLPVNIKSGTLYMGVPDGIEVLVLDINNRSVIKKMDLPDVVRGKYTAVKIDYYDQDKKSLISYQAGDDTAPESQILRYYDAPVSTHDEAVTYANAALKEQNSKGNAKGSVTLIGTPLTSGQEIHFKGAGKAHAKWQVLNQTTTVSDAGWTGTANIGKKE
ncbi:phage late control D family protein [Vibrio sp. OPT18]|uniref:phage late control D family protein n=1 Tax=Vibrio sp. OPT18 TaxID=2778641 RepID=UPI0018823422|nr:hypothetical protein [Vibrio sp. OPT18]MBE8578704.1 hypothetical protein [Vibrio sp. OPT18]